MSSAAIHAVMVTPSASGGHPLYTWELMTALRAAAPLSELDLTLLTSVDLAPAFRKAQYRIADVLPAMRGAFANRLEWAASRIVHYAHREEAVLRWVRAQPRVDILHYQEPPFAAAVHISRARATGARVVATVHNVRPHGHPVPAAGPLIEFSTNLGWKQCAMLFVHSPVLREELLRELGSRSPRVVAIPHGVWTSHRGMAVTPNPMGYLLFFGVMRRNKGVHLMLDAMRHLPGKRLVMAGAFPDRSLALEVRGRIGAEHLQVELQDRIISDSEIPGLFGGAALVMLPYTDYYAQSGVLHMAIAYGIPVVVADVGALGEQVRKEKIGAVAAAGDAEDLARATLLALEPGVYEAARTHCSALAGELSWSAAARITLEAYREACYVR